MPCLYFRSCRCTPSWNDWLRTQIPSQMTLDPLINRSTLCTRMAMTRWFDTFIYRLPTGLDLSPAVSVVARFADYRAVIQPNSVSVGSFFRLRPALSYPLIGSCQCNTLMRRSLVTYLSYELQGSSAPTRKPVSLLPCVAQCAHILL